MIRLSVSRNLGPATAVILLATIAAGCGGSRDYVVPSTPGGGSGTTPGTPPGPAPTGVVEIQLSPSSGSIAVGETLQLSAVALDAQGKPVSGVVFTWQSSDTSIAEVSTAGLVTAKKAGTVQITAASAGKTGTATIEVRTEAGEEEEKPPAPPPASTR
ncbi:MAG: Ig-like domain-containing protein [Armatimonadota bacterium]